MLLVLIGISVTIVPALVATVPRNIQPTRIGVNPAHKTHAVVQASVPTAPLLTSTIFSNG